MGRLRHDIWLIQRLLPHTAGAALTHGERTHADGTGSGATPRRLRDATDGHTDHGTRPAGDRPLAEREVDETDACELGSQAALDAIRHGREAEYW